MNFLIYRPGSQVRVPIKFVNQEDCVDIKRGEGCSAHCLLWL